jgi:hypothetical protein
MAVDGTLAIDSDLQIPDSIGNWLVSIQPGADGAITQLLFNEFARQWHEETRFSSDTGFITSRDSYRRIVDMGYSAVPHILRDLATRGGDWFTALEAITGESPVPQDDYGFPRRMKTAWLNWGRARGIQV